MITLVNSHSFTEGDLDFWKSLKNSKKSINKWLVVEYMPWTPLFQNATKMVSFDDLELVTCTTGYPGNVERFRPLLYVNTSPEEFWIFTDTSDVIVQTKVPKLDINEIYVSPEGVTFEECNFWDPYIIPYPEMKKEPIYNMGCWAMSAIKAKEMLKFVLDECSKGYQYTSDQLAYNIWLKDKKPTEHPSLFSCLYNNYELGNCVKKDGKFYNKRGDLYTFIHANGNTKGLIYE